MTTGATLTAVGRPLTRVDGPAKVTGSGRYAAEYTLPGTVYAALVGARTACGRITDIDTRAAENADGVLAVLTHRNLPKIAGPPHLLPPWPATRPPGRASSRCRTRPCTTSDNPWPW